MNQDKLLSDFGKSLGLTLQFDKNKQCLLLLDENLIVSVCSKEKNWVFYCMLGEVMTNTFPTLWEWFSKTNLFLLENQLGGLAYEYKTNTLLYIFSIELPTTSQNIFNQFETIVDTYSKLNRNVKIEEIILCH